MKNFEIGLIIGFIIIGVICVCDQCGAEEYIVPNFIGGINVATDSTDLGPNQALNLTNLTFDMPNVLTSRQGYSYWNSTAFTGSVSDEIEGITAYNDQLISVAGVNIFKNTSRISWTGDSIVVFNDSNYIYDIGDHDWLYLKATYGDEIIIGAQTDTISLPATTDDTTLVLFHAYGGSTDTVESYTVKLSVYNFTSFAEYSDILYILSDDTYDGFTMVYNDTAFKYLSVIDTGVISNTISPDTNTFIISGLARGFLGTRTFMAGNNENWGNVTVGDIFYYEYLYQFKIGLGSPGLVTTYKKWYSTITAVDTTEPRDKIEVERVFELDGFNASLLDVYNPYEIRREYYVPVVSGDSADYGVMEDTTKIWGDFELGDRLYQNFFYVASDSGYEVIKTIYSNDDTTFVIKGRMSDDQPYYIMSAIPTPLLQNDVFIDSFYKEQPRIKQMLFYGGQWYGIGTYNYSYYTGWRGYPNPFGDLDTLYKARYDRVWYSHPGFPAYINRNYFFELDDEITSVLFVLRGRLYIGTTEGIWTSTGTPRLVNTVGNQILEKVVSNRGIPDLDNWAKATEEYGYFTNRTGVYRFDGVRPEKISWLVDPIIEDNYNSRIVMTYQNHDLYISFTDSNFTLVYDERFESFTKLDFGMTCAYAPPDSDFIYFGLNGHPGRIYYYPNGEYWDRNSPTDSSGIAIEYQSGWQTFAGYWINKKIAEAYFPMLTPDTASISIYSDFSGTADDVVTADDSTRFVYRDNPDNDATGEYFQVAIRDTVDGQIIIGGYRIVWNDIEQWKK